MNMATCTTQSPHGSSSPNPKRQKSNQDASCATRMSDLPNHILLHILSFLPTRDVVATGVLSKRWQNFWMSVPSLNFEDHNFPKKQEGSRKVTFENVVNRVLFEHNASIQKFRISCINRQSCDIEPWIKKAIARKVEELDLNTPGFSKFQLPRTTFSCKTLVVLKLSGASITLLVPRTALMPNLKVLELDSVSYGDDESASNLISCCLVLENLSIRRTTFDKLRVHSQTLKSLECVANGMSRNIAVLDINAPLLHYRISRNVAILDINAPLLHDLTIKDLNFESLQVTNTSSLYKVNLELNKIFSLQSVINCFEALINNVKFLSLSGDIPTALDIESRLPPEKFFNLTHLTLGTKGVWRQMLLHFLQCFEKLEVLEIMKDEFYSISSFPEKSWKEPAFVPSCLMSCLRVIRIHDFRESEFELGMLKYMLKNGSILQKVEIHPADPYCPEQKFCTRKREKARDWENRLLVSESNYRKLQVKFSIAKKLMNFHKGSQTCEIDFF